MNRWEVLRWIRYVTGVYGRPDFFIIGAQKSGTTSLWQCLLQHPRIIFRVKKEVHYWGGRNFENGHRWYASHFPSTVEKKLRTAGRAQPLLSGEATPVMGKAGVPGQLRAAYSDLKLIAILRNPVERAFSNVKLFRYHRPERTPDTFEEALCEMEGIRRRGLYARHLRRWFAHFGREQVLILSFDRFVRDPQAVLNECFAFLGVPAVDVEPRHANQSGDDSEIPAAIEEELREFYRPHNRDLYELLGCDFGWPA